MSHPVAAVWRVAPLTPTLLATLAAGCGMNPCHEPRNGSPTRPATPENSTCTATPPKPRGNRHSGGVGGGSWKMAQKTICLYSL